MSRVAFAFILVSMAAMFLPSCLLASDGDVSYSAPYITVDPKTGELITVNPGPHPKVHSGTPIANASAAPRTPLHTSAGAVPDISTADDDPILNVFVVFIGVIALVALVAAAVWRTRRKRLGLDLQKPPGSYRATRLSKPNA